MNLRARRLLINQCVQEREVAWFSSPRGLLAVGSTARGRLGKRRFGTHTTPTGPHGCSLCLRIAVRERCRVGFEHQRRRSQEDFPPTSFFHTSGHAMSDDGPGTLSTVTDGSSSPWTSELRTNPFRRALFSADRAHGAREVEYSVLCSASDTSPSAQITRHLAISPWRATHPDPQRLEDVPSGAGSWMEDRHVTLREGSLTWVGKCWCRKGMRTQNTTSGAAGYVIGGLGKGEGTEVVNAVRLLPHAMRYRAVVEVSSPSCHAGHPAPVNTETEAL